MTRQRAYQLRKIAEGKCPGCGGEATAGMRRCAPCQEKHRVLNARRESRSAAVMLAQINGWWWALQPNGGSIRMKYGKYFYYPESLRSNGPQRWQNYQTRKPIGPFSDLVAAIDVAQKNFPYELRLSVPSEKPHAT